METRLKSREPRRHAGDGGGGAGAGADEAAALKPRACANCARLKMKCRWPEALAESEMGCTRCARMKLACHVPMASDRRKRGKSTRVAQLEQKIDGIVSLLAAHKHIQENGPFPVAPDSQPCSQAPPKQPNDGFVDASASGHGPDLLAFELLPGFCLSSDEAVAFLDMYKRDLMPNYPFVLVPPTMDAHALFSHSPVLFWVVMAAVAPQSAAVQQDVRKWLRQFLSEHMIVKQKKTLQMLQAILVHLAWGDYHFYVYSDATDLLQLAMALIIDLRLDKSPGLSGSSSKSLLGEAWMTINRGVPYRIGVPHTPAEQRAVLGFYHLSSLVSSLCRRGPQLGWNNYLSQCCESLVEARERGSDLYLAALVRMQRIADRIHAILPFTGSGDEEASIYRAPHGMAVASIRRELDSFANAQPGPASQNTMFWACYHAQVMRLYEPIVSMRAPPASDPDAFPHDSPIQRTEALWKCLQSAADCFDAFLAIPAAQLPSLPLTATGLLTFAIVTTARLLLLDSLGDWQPELARQKLDFAVVLQSLADWFEQADGWAEQAGRRRRLKDGVDGVFCQYTVKLRCMRQWYLSKIGPSQTRLDGAAQQAVAGQWPDVGVELDMFWPELLSTQDGSLQGPAMMGWPT